ncbi:MAG TPA: hypothetical protein VGF89_10595 [Steroidobacteraceae bacterium]|jgi:hypothetical protein
MKRITRITTVSALAGLGLSACGGGNSSGPAMTQPPPSMGQTLDTNAVLALAQKTSDSAAPIAVDDGALSLSDTSEDTAPVAINGM